MNKYYQLSQNGSEADIYIYGDITSWEWIESDVSSYTLARELQELDVHTINVFINSYGGEVAEGLAIFNSLKNHKAKVKTVCDGFACSAASVIFMAGEERVMNNASLLMIHNAWTFTGGNADELRKQADDLETISAVAANAYREVVNISDEELDQLLADESWIAPTDALAMGFATSIVGDSQVKGVNQSAKKAVFQMLMKAKQEKPLDGPQDPIPQEPQQKTVTTFLDALAGGKD